MKFFRLFMLLLFLLVWAVMPLLAKANCNGTKKAASASCSGHKSAAQLSTKRTVERTTTTTTERLAVADPCPRRVGLVQASIDRSADRRADRRARVAERDAVRQAVRSSHRFVAVSVDHCCASVASPCTGQQDAPTPNPPEDPNYYDDGLGDTRPATPGGGCQQCARVDDNSAPTTKTKTREVDRERRITRTGV